MTHHPDINTRAVPRRRHPRVRFAAVAALAALGLFVLDGALAGVVMLLAMLGFIGACIYALRGQDAETMRSADRTGLSGWIGGF
jgi:hypothetical protein